MALHLLAILCIGFILDFIIGDPHGLWHPVQGIGLLITLYERMLRKAAKENPAALRICGGVLVILVLVSAVAIAALLLWVAFEANKWIGYGLACVISWQMLAAKSLRTESMKVCTALKQEGLMAGRKAVSMIVGRDTESLSEEGVIKAAVETVAENTSDGITAPLFYMMIGGPLLGVLYKAVNTMDSMIGYKNEKYRYFGTCAAKLDDLMNYIPARVSAWFMILASGLLNMNIKQAWKIYRRDRKNHKSPNAAQTEAVMAGALEIQLAGDAWYFGELHEKPYIGDPLRKIQAEDIKRACRLEYGSVILSFIVMAAVKIGLIMLF